MFVEAGGPHHLAHFHAYYQDDIAIYGIEKIERLAGSLPTRQERLVLAWAELHDKASYWRIGTSCKAVIRRLKLNR